MPDALIDTAAWRRDRPPFLGPPFPPFASPLFCASVVEPLLLALVEDEMAGLLPVVVGIVVGMLLAALSIVYRVASVRERVQYFLTRKERAERRRRERALDDAEIERMAQEKAQQEAKQEAKSQAEEEGQRGACGEGQCCGGGCGEEAAPSTEAARGRPSAAVQAPRFPHASVTVLYGTQSGTAERFAKELGQEASRLGWGSVSVTDLAEYDDQALREEDMVILVVATYIGGTYALALPQTCALCLHTCTFTFTH